MTGVPENQGAALDSTSHRDDHITGASDRAGCGMSKVSEEPCPRINSRTDYSAADLDRMIDADLEKLNEALARTYISVARALATIRATKGYRDLGYSTWEAYLEAKRNSISRHAYSKSFAYLLAKLGRANDIDEVLPPDIGGSQLMAYVAACRSPEQIGPLINTTWNDVKSHPIRELRSCLRQITRAESFGASQVASNARGDTKLAKSERYDCAVDASSQDDFAVPGNSIADFSETKPNQAISSDVASKPDLLKTILLQHAEDVNRFHLPKLLGDLLGLDKSLRPMFEAQIKQFVEDEISPFNW